MSSTANIVARRILLSGHVQGVGFRPHVYRVATGLGLTGWVQNRMGQVLVRVAGPDDRVQAFLRDVIDKAPPLSAPRIESVEQGTGDAQDAFVIRDSATGPDAAIFVPPDTSVCPDCLREMHDPQDRRYRYPFINCTQCGPRYTLIEAMPYDRPNTTMAGFPLCQACQQEYEDPSNRRFHAEPVACPDCGPSVWLAGPDGATRATGEAGWRGAAEALMGGQIVAVRGVGGYHLMCDARDPKAVQRLRDRKRRPDKPFAVMVPWRGADGLAAIRALAHVTEPAARTLVSAVRPIVLLPKRSDATLAEPVAPDCAELGLFLPYSPLHDLLLEAVGGPLVATSANLSGEPVLTAPDEIETRLGGVADVALHHNRPIARPADDPVLREIGGAVVPLRVGRGNAPVEMALARPVPAPVLAVGAQMKATVALGFGDRAVVSPHIGEMEAPRSLEVLERVSDSLQSLYDSKAAVILCDAHPGYTTHNWARRRGPPVVPILHHHAHASALAGEHPEATGPWLTFAWDGVGMGADGTLWGGDALWGGPGRWQRVARFRPFRLTGGDRAGREPWRSAAALCWEAGLALPGLPEGSEIARQAWEKGINTFVTTAAGRMFDAAACLITGRTHASYEAQGPVGLEALAAGETGRALPLGLTPAKDGVLEADWAPLLSGLADSNGSPQQRAADFHASMAQSLVDQVQALAEKHEIAQVGLTGGVFQNARLVQEVGDRLAAIGITPRLNRRLPCNDAAISFGQVVEYAAQMEKDPG